MNKPEIMGKESIAKLLFKFALPAVTATIVNTLYNVVDRIYIGRGVGPLGLSGITVSFPLMMLVMAIGMLIAYGTNSLISIKLGEKDKDGAEELLGQGFFLFICFSIIFSVIAYIFAENILVFFGASEQVLPYALSYMRIIVLGTIFQEISFGVNNFIRGEGQPKIAMITMLIGAIANIILDPIFIFHFDMGMRGAALATVLSNALSAFWVLRFYFGGKSVLKVRVKYLTLKLPLLSSVLLVGLPPFIMHFTSTLIQALFNYNLKTYSGDMAISVIGVVYTVFMMFFMPIIGIGQGGQPLIGYNHGAKNYDRVKQTLNLMLFSTAVISISGYLLFMSFPAFIFSMFNSDPEFISMGVYALRRFMSCFPLICSVYVVSTYYQSIGQPKKALFLSVFRQTIIQIPFLIILPRYIGVDAVWYSEPVSVLSGFIISIIFLRYEFKKLNQKQSIII